MTVFQYTITLLQKRFAGATSDGEVIRFKAYLSLAHNNRGSALQETGQVMRAIECYTEAIHLNLQLAEAFYNRGTAFALLGKKSEASRDLESAIGLGFDSETPKSSPDQQAQSQGQPD